MLLSQGGVQYAQAGELTPEQARQMIMNAQNPHPGVSPGIGTEKDWVGRLFAEEYAKGYAKTTGELAAGALSRGVPTAGRAALEAGGEALARNPSVYVNAADFGPNLARGYELGRNLNIFSGPMSPTPGAWLGHGAGVAWGVWSRLGGAVIGWFGQ